MDRNAAFAWIKRQGLPHDETVAARRIVRRFERDFGVCPDLDPPRRYVEWVIHRLILERDPLLTTVSDKFAMRAHVRQILGHDPMVPLLQVCDSAAGLDWDALPRSCILKASHGSGWNIVVHNTARADRAGIAARMQDWVGRSIWTERLAWAYRDVPARVLAEPLLRRPGCKQPDDICIYCFGGVPQYIRVNRYPTGVGKTSGCFDGALRPLALYADPPTADFPDDIDPAPLLAMARRLSAGFVYLRVDFMVADGRAWLGELTLYPGGGRATAFRDDAAERLVGELYAAAHARRPQPFVLEGRSHFRAPPRPVRATAAAHGA